MAENSTQTSHYSWTWVGVRVGAVVAVVGIAYLLLRKK